MISLWLARPSGCIRKQEGPGQAGKHLGFWERQAQTEGRPYPQRNLPVALGFLVVQQLPRLHLLPKGDRAESACGVYLTSGHEHIFVLEATPRSHILCPLPIGLG